MIRIANAPCSWGALEFDLGAEEPDYIQVLDEIAETGYEGTELGDWGFLPTNSDELSDELHNRGLKLLGAFVPVPFKNRNAHQTGVEDALRIARLMAAVEGDLPFIILADENGSVPERTQNAGRVTPEMGLSEEQWEIFAEGVTRVSEAVKRETGLRTAYHHHCAGYVETPQEIEKLMSLTGSGFGRAGVRLRTLPLWRRGDSAGRPAQIREAHLALPLQGPRTAGGQEVCGRQVGLF